MTFLLDKVLERVRTELKDSLTDSVIKQLLDDLNDEKVFGEEEVESILQQNPLQADRARCLIGSVKKKGPKADSPVCFRVLVFFIHLSRYSPCRFCDPGLLEQL
uniref:CARD domain-containing protein n=1 Tax=Electrophorus electricus TaxID=8005 RepID=A0AAY5F1T7_ELEEL